MTRFTPEFTELLRKRVECLWKHQLGRYSDRQRFRLSAVGSPTLPGGIGIMDEQLIKEWHSLKAK